MTASTLSAYIRALPIPARAPDLAHDQAPATERAGTPGADGLSGAVPDTLPEAIVAGSAMLAFDAGLGPELRSSVALSLLAAQRVAGADPVARTPDAWVERHDMVLRGLNWLSVAGGTVFSEAVGTSLAVREAILPMLETAFGPAGGSSRLILAALRQLGETGADAPWLTLFDRESRRFDVSEYRFATAEASGNAVVLRMAAARVVAVEDRVQVLLFRFGGIDVSLSTAQGTLVGNANLLEAMNGDLALRLRSETRDYIRALPV